jgi:hypothetical protein
VSRVRELRKAFDSVEIWCVLESLQRCQIDWRYIQVMRCLYESATMSVQVQNQQTKLVPTIASRSQTRGRYILEYHILPEPIANR